MMPLTPFLARPRLWLYGALLAALVAGGWLGYGWAYERGRAAERAVWAASTAEAAARFAQALDAQLAVAAKLEGDLATARRRNQKRQETLTDAVQNDPAARDWAREPIPDGVRAALGGGADLPADPAGAH